MGFRVQIWSGGALWNPLSFLIKDSIQSNLWTGKESSLLKIQLVKNTRQYTEQSVDRQGEQFTEDSISQKHSRMKKEA